MIFALERRTWIEVEYPRRVEIGKVIYIENKDQLWGSDIGKNNKTIKSGVKGKGARLLRADGRYRMVTPSTESVGSVDELGFERRI